MDFGRSATLTAMRRLAVIAAVLAAFAVSGCAAPAASFDPAAPCTRDARLPGAYPDLEQLIPASFQGQAPASVDSGRNCTTASIGTLAGVGVEELQFAGGLWETGRRSGVTLAVVRSPALTGQQVFDFYHAGALAARRTETIDTTIVESASGRDILSLTTLNGESFQTIQVQEAAEAGLVRVVLVGSDVRENASREAHDSRVSAAAEAFFDR